MALPSDPQDTIIDFLSKFRVDATTGCWMWTGRQTKGGYGQISVSGKTMYAHRWAFAHYNDDLSDHLCVCHECDHPGCVNPEHLFLGTRGDNNRDCSAKGRSFIPRGSLHPRAKLNEEIVKVVRARLGTTREKVASVARELGVSAQSLRRAVKGLSWRHVT